MAFISEELLLCSDPTSEHPTYIRLREDRMKIRDCVQSESWIKAKREIYLPRPAGMSGKYADAYDGYISRAHFPLIAAYALQGALGIVNTKLPEFNVPKKLEYILKSATKDGCSLRQLFTDMIIEILQTGTCPITIDVVPSTLECKFVRYKSENFINWKDAIDDRGTKGLILAVLTEDVPADDDVFSNETEVEYKVLTLNANNVYTVYTYRQKDGFIPIGTIPNYQGRVLKSIPLFVPGSINNNMDTPQPIPLLSVANCSLQIYRKEADLANSEYLSCNPTLCITGASNDDELPNVVGSSVMIVLPEPTARVFYTTTDTAALQHVKQHIDDLYDEAIRHGVAILDTRKGVEASEALRIRQATQSASLYSMYLSVCVALESGLKTMCEWMGLDATEVFINAPTELAHGIPDSTVIREMLSGFSQGAVPISAVHRYMVSNGLVDQGISLDEYKKELQDNKEFRKSVKDEPPKPVVGAPSNSAPKKVTPPKK